MDVRAFARANAPPTLATAAHPKRTHRGHRSHRLDIIGPRQYHCPQRPRLRLL